MKLYPLLLTVIFSTPALADDAVKKNWSIYDLTLKELMKVSVITSASGFEQSVDQVFAANTVIRAEEWQAFGATTLSDALKMVEGMHVGKSTISPNHQHFPIRGLGGKFGEQIKLMIDGRPMKPGTHGGMLYGFNLPLGSFKRIEVVRGQGSAIYGADAFGGVINLVSKDRADITPTIAIGAGDFGTRQFSLQQSFGQENTYLSLSLDYMNYDDDPDRIITADLQTTIDDAFGTSASNAPGRFDEHFEVMTFNAHGQWQDWSLDYFGWRNFDAGLASGAAQALDTKGHIANRVDIWTLDWAMGNTFGWESLNLTANYHKHSESLLYYIFPEGSKLPVGADGNINFAQPVGTTLFTDGVIGAPSNHGHYLNLNLTQVWSYQDHKVRWQLGYQEDVFSTVEHKNFGPGILDGSEQVVDGQLTDVTGTPYIYLNNASDSFYFLSLMDQWQLNEQWLINVGARYDHYSSFGSTTNPRIGLIYSANSSLKVKLFAGSAFRAPSFYESQIRNNPIVIGNANLKPETVDTLETGLGLEYAFGENFFITSNLFKYHAKDLISFEFVEQLKLSQAQNVGEIKGRGVEIGVRYKPNNNVTLQMNLSVLDAEDQHEDILPNYPTKSWYGALNWRLNEQYSWSIDGRWVDDRHRESGDTRAPIDNYFWLNSTLTAKALLPHLDATFSVRNLLNTDAREPAASSIPDDFPLHGRLWRIGLRYGF